MPVFFAATFGSTVAIQDSSVIQSTFRPLISLAKSGLSFNECKSFVTRVTISTQTNHQFLHSLGGDLYIYVFGDRVGELNISGMSVGSDCSNPGDTQHGIEKIYNFYATNKLSRRATPIGITLGQSTVFQAFLASFNADVYDHKANLIQYSLGLFLLPEKPTTAAAAAASIASSATVTNL